MPTVNANNPKAMMPSAIPIDETIQPANMIISKLIQSLLLAVCSNALMEKQKIAGMSIPVKTAFPCQILTKVKTPVVNTENALNIWMNEIAIKNMPTVFVLFLK